MTPPIGQCERLTSALSPQPCADYRGECPLSGTRGRSPSVPVLGRRAGLRVIRIGTTADWGSARLCPHRYLSHPADTFGDMEAQHIGPLLGIQLFVAPIAYFIWAVSAATYRIVLDHSHRLRRAVLRWRKQNSMTVDSWFWFGTTWAVLNVAVYILVTAAF